MTISWTCPWLGRCWLGSLIVKVITSYESEIEEGTDDSQMRTKVVHWQWNPSTREVCLFTHQRRAQEYLEGGTGVFGRACDWLKDGTWPDYQIAKTRYFCEKMLLTWTWLMNCCCFLENL